MWRFFGLAVKRFADLGCGNGLLVYILNDQGFGGYGVDMRRRRVWQTDAYRRRGVELRERSVNPQLEGFADCDWLIGNHSDELSPWLPVMAARAARLSGRACHFLLIPCCLFDFHGRFVSRLSA